MADKFAIVTGGSSGIGLELARLAAADGYDLLLAADTPLDDAKAALSGVDVQGIEVDLSTFEGVDRLLAAANSRAVDALFANASHGLGGPFLEQSPSDWRHVIDTNVTGTVYLIQRVVQTMVARDSGRVLVTGSIAGHIAGAFNAVYNSSKFFIDSFTDALGNEIKDTAVTITNLKPGATETEFFERAHLEDTKVGTSKKDPADAVAKTGYDAMMAGERSVVHGLKNKVQVAVAKVVGGGIAAEIHRSTAEPGSGR